MKQNVRVQGGKHPEKYSVTRPVGGGGGGCGADWPLVWV